MSGNENFYPKGTKEHRIVDILQGRPHAYIEMKEAELKKKRIARLVFFLVYVLCPFCLLIALIWRLGLLHRI